MDVIRGIRSRHLGREIPADPGVIAAALQRVAVGEVLVFEGFVDIAAACEHRTDNAVDDATQFGVFAPGDPVAGSHGVAGGLVLVLHVEVEDGQIDV